MRWKHVCSLAVDVKPASPPSEQLESTMTALKILTAVFILTGLSACASYYGQADHTPPYVVQPNNAFPR
jgi:hypothetical protein